MSFITFKYRASKASEEKLFDHKRVREHSQICEYAYDLLYLLNPKCQPSASRIPFKKGLNPVYDVRDYTPGVGGGGYSEIFCIHRRG